MLAEKCDQTNRMHKNVRVYVDSILNRKGSIVFAEKACLKKRKGTLYFEVSVKRQVGLGGCCSVLLWMNEMMK